MFLGRSLLAMGVMVVLGSVGCGKNRERNQRSLAPLLLPESPVPSTPSPSAEELASQVQPQGGGVVKSPERALQMPKHDSDRIDLGGGSFVPLEFVSGEPYVGIRGLVEESSFARLVSLDGGVGGLKSEEQRARLKARMQTVVEALAKSQGRMLGVQIEPELGYFTARIKLSAYQNLAQVKNLPVDLWINPVIRTPGPGRIERMEQELSDRVLVDGRANNAAYSGLKRMRVPEFLQELEAELGKIPDGAGIKVGVADTGITFAHPTFGNAEGASRISYMRDFTGEGRLYFNPKARFVVATPSSDELPKGADAKEVLVIDAQVIKPVVTATTEPVADNYQDFKRAVLVTADLASELLLGETTARLAIVSEGNFKSESEQVDLNRNGKTDDQLLALLVQKGDVNQVYFTAAQGEETPDFRLSPRLASWNQSQQVMRYGPEAFGFDIGTHELKDQAGEAVTVLGASLVGFDPGNHGTHVSGIILGKRLLGNDSETTLARGVAPGATLLAGRVCANQGGCSSSEAIIDLAKAGAEIINMSLGGLSSYNDGYDVDSVLIDRLTAKYGVLFVIAAGNEGPGFNTVGSPGVARSALAVGATASRSMIERQYQWPGLGKTGSAPAQGAAADDDFMLYFSSRGPSGAGGFKPELVAPGTELSAIQLNSAPGADAGLSVMWGTSMATPAAAGAAALLLDAAKIYNASHPEAPLATDPTTIKRVLIASARPFDVHSYDPVTGQHLTGQYTWIDQGKGLLDLPRAWALLKDEQRTRLPSSLKVANPALATDLALDYQVRVLRKNPNGNNYDGSLGEAELQPGESPRFGRGLWLAHDTTETLYTVQIARRLPLGAAGRPDIGELLRLLETTADRFVLKTTFFGSASEWLKAGTLSQLDCQGSATADLNVIALGAVDNFKPEKPTDSRSLPVRSSTLNVCVDTGKLAALPAGDHGALIEAYRSDGDRTEAVPSFIVPVYLAKPHKTLAGQAGYAVQGIVQSFGIARNYVQVPEGASVVTVKLEVPEAVSDSLGQVKGCAGVKLFALEAKNTATPKELEGEGGIAANCGTGGASTPDKRVVQFARTNPRAGLWNLHVFGRNGFRESPYTLSVDYAKVLASLTELVGQPKVLNGEFSFSVKEASFAAEPAAAASHLRLDGFSRTTDEKVALDEEQVVLDHQGGTLRQYDESVATVTFETFGSEGNDLDLYAQECDDAEGKICKQVAQSSGATDVESLSFTPAKGKFYKAVVKGFDVTQGDGVYKFKETRVLAKAEQGAISVAPVSGEARSWTITHSFDTSASVLLKSPLYTSGAFKVVGRLEVNTQTKAVMLALPVNVSL